MYSGLYRELGLKSMVIYNRRMAANPKSRRLMSWVIVALGLLAAFQMSLNIWKVYRSGSRIDQASKALETAKRQQQDLQKNLNYVQTSEFIEKEAREKLGMGRPGEVVLIMPKFDTKPQETGEPNLASWQKWWRLYGWNIVN